MINNASEPVIAFDQSCCIGYYSVFLHDRGIIVLLSFPDTCDRQEGCPSELILLQILDYVLCGLLILGNDMRHRSAQSRFHGRFILFLNRYKVSDNAVDSVESGAVLHDVANRGAIPLISLGYIFQRFKLAFSSEELFMCTLVYGGKLLLLLGVGLQ